jgi:hypothetical protein
MDTSKPKFEQLLLLNYYNAPSIMAGILSFGAFYTTPSWRIVESLRRIDN